MRGNFSQESLTAGFVTATRIEEKGKRPDAGQFQGPRVIVVAANRSATWPSAPCRTVSHRWPSPSSFSSACLSSRLSVAFHRLPSPLLLDVIVTRNT